MIVAGLLTPIEDVLTTVLEWLHGTIGLPWAWSIVALTVVVRVLLVPLTVRQIHSMQNLQAYAPQMKEIQRKYKADKQRMNEELMKFYKENKINPAASCLPMLAQFPIFIALYFVLRPLLVPRRPEHHRRHLGALVGLPAPRDLRREPGLVDVLHVDDDGPDAADADDGPAGRLRLLHHRSAWRNGFPGRPAPLLDDDEPLDGRSGSRDEAASAQTGRAGAEAHVSDADARRGRRRRAP